MSDLDDLYQKLPPTTREILSAVWDTLPQNEKSDLLSLLNGIPGNAGLVRSLIRMSVVQLKIAFGQKHKVAIVGPANVGKSTLYNQFILAKSDRADVGPLPGTTRANHQSDVGLFAIIDTPGADAVGEVGIQEREEALRAANDADFLIIMFDAIQGIKQTELDLYARLLGLNKPYVVVLNKIDLVRRHENDVVISAAKNLNLQPEQLIPLNATNGQNINRVLAAIVMTEPGIVAALGRALPEYRWQLAWRAIVSAASVSALIALTPIPVIDFIPLVAIQSSMVVAIARIYNYKITLARSRELIATFGIGFLGRTIFFELSKLGGIPGWLLSAAVAASTTVAMGYAARIWFEKGERLSAETVSKIAHTLTGYILESLRTLGKRKPGSKSLQESIAAALTNAKLEEIQSPHPDDQTEQTP